jgi:hypothetical protein
MRSALELYAFCTESRCRGGVAAQKLAAEHQNRNYLPILTFAFYIKLTTNPILIKSLYLKSA